MRIETYIKLNLMYPGYSFVSCICTQRITSNEAYGEGGLCLAYGRAFAERV